MITPQLILNLNRELFVDNFAGGGGASTGIEMALGRHVDHAVNHDEHALGMHRMNHPQTIHHCEDVFDVEPGTLANGRAIGGAWFSPDCKHFSKAKGGKPLSKKIRGLAFVMLRYAKYRSRVIYMENVEEIKTWGPLLPDGKPDPAHIGRTWSSFLSAIGTGVAEDSPDLDEMLDVLGHSVSRAELVRGFGYEVQTRELRACDYGAPTIRKRLFLIARCDGLPIVWPEPTHASPKDARKLRLKPWRTVAECIDWSVPVNSIFLSQTEARRFKCRRPLAKATLRRIAAGIDRYVLKSEKPFLISLTHQGGDRIEGIDEPSKTLTAANRGEKALVNATMAPVIGEHANASNQRTMPADAPLRTQCAEVKGGHFSLVAGVLARTAHGDVDKNGKRRGRGSHSAQEPLPSVLGSQDCALVASNLIKLRGNVETHGNTPDITEPAHTVSAGGQHHAITAAYLAQHNGGFNTTPGHRADEPASTISARGSQQQIVAANLAAYYGNDKDGQAMDEPTRTVTTRERFCMAESMAVQPLTAEQVGMARRVAEFLRAHGVQFEGEFATVKGYVIVDIGMRMLLPRELFRAQGFSDSYIIDRAWVVNRQTGEVDEVELTKEQQIRMCGNSVCPQVARAIVAANSPDMAIRKTSIRAAYA